MKNIETRINDAIAKLDRFGYARVFFGANEPDAADAMNTVEQTFRSRGCYVRPTVYCEDFRSESKCYGYLTICPQW